MRNVVHRRQRAPENQQHGRIAVDAKVLRKLVVRPLNERTVNSVDGFAAAFGNSGGQGHGMLLGDADIHELRPGLPAALRREAHHRQGSRRNGHHAGPASSVRADSAPSAHRIPSAPAGAADSPVARGRTAPANGRSPCPARRGRIPLPFSVLICTTTGCAASFTAEKRPVRGPPRHCRRRHSDNRSPSPGRSCRRSFRSFRAAPCRLR